MKPIAKTNRNEGFSDMEIGNLIRKEMSAAKYDPRTIRRALPPSAKHIEMVREQNAFADKMSANEHENKVIVLPADKSEGSPLPANTPSWDAKPKTHEPPTKEQEQLVSKRSKQMGKDIEEFGSVRISKLPENKELLRFEIPIPKAIFWEHVEDHVGEDYGKQFWISGIMNQETGKILSLSMGRIDTSQI